jgi:hypothetical protein
MNAYKNLVGKPERDRKPRCRREDNIEMDLRKIISEVVDWIHLAKEGLQYRAFVNTVMNLQFPKRQDIS